MDFTVLAVVLLLGIGIPARNKFIRNYRDMKKTRLLTMIFQKLLLPLGKTSTAQNKQNIPSLLFQCAKWTVFTAV